MHSPVILIGFNRDTHFERTLNALSSNVDANKTRLYCFIDGAKSKEDFIKQQRMVNIANQYTNLFANVKIIVRENNIGLANNITSAVTEILSKYGKIIVLEDDIVTSKLFLKYMNDALNFYENEEKVWHISAYNEINDQNRKSDIFLWRFMNCWGWGTWRNRWEHYEKDPVALINDFSRNDVREFDLNDSGLFWEQVIANAEGRINTWAIFWYATIFKHSGLCVSPWFSYSKNIGFDGSGVHCNSDINKMRSQKLNEEGVFKGTVDLREDQHALKVMLKVHAKKRYSVRTISVNFFRLLLGQKIINLIKTFMSRT